MRLAVAVLALAGCSRVLGLDDIPIDQGALTVYGTLTTRRVLNSQTRLPYLADDAPLKQAPANMFVELDDQSRRILTWNGDGTFSFDREQLTQAYRLVFPGSFTEPTVEYQLTGAQLAILDREWGRAASERTTAMAGTSVQYSFATPPAPGVTGTLFLDSSGLWTETPILGSVPTNESFTLVWASAFAVPEAQPVALLDAEIQYDRLYYVLYEPASATTSTLARYRFDDVSLKDGTTTQIVNQPVYTVQADTCVQVQAPRSVEIGHITAAGYVAQTPATAMWRLLALPVLAMGPDVSFPLAYDPGTSDFLPKPIDFGTPFTGYDLLLELTASAAHPVLAPGAMVPAVLAFGSDQYVEPQAVAASVGDAECAMQTPSKFPGIQLPTAPLLDGFPLDRDQPIQLDRTRLAKLTWTTTQTGALPEMYRADLFEVAADATLTTQLRPHATWYTTNHTPDGAPQVLVDPALLEAGKSYVIEISDIVGQPGAAGGDLSLLHYPYAIGYSYTGVLEVTN